MKKLTITISDQNYQDLIRAKEEVKKLCKSNPELKEFIRPTFSSIINYHLNILHIMGFDDIVGIK